MATTPQYAPTVDAAGNIYGGAETGGSGGAGIVYELALSNGQYQETVLHAFTGGLDGGSPYGGVILDSSGNVYGTAETGGEYGGGVAWEITP